MFNRKRYYAVGMGAKQSSIITRPTTPVRETAHWSIDSGSSNHHKPSYLQLLNHLETIADDSGDFILPSVVLSIIALYAYEPQRLLILATQRKERRMTYIYEVASSLPSLHPSYRSMSHKANVMEPLIILGVAPQPLHLPVMYKQTNNVIILTSSETRTGAYNVHRYSIMERLWCPEIETLVWSPIESSSSSKLLLITSQMTYIGDRFMSWGIEVDQPAPPAPGASASSTTSLDSSQQSQQQGQRQRARQPSKRPLYITTRDKALRWISSTTSSSPRYWLTAACHERTATNDSSWIHIVGVDHRFYQWSCLSCRGQMFNPLTGTWHIIASLPKKLFELPYLVNGANSSNDHHDYNKIGIFMLTKEAQVAFYHINGNRWWYVSWTVPITINIHAAIVLETFDIHHHSNHQQRPIKVDSYDLLPSNTPPTNTRNLRGSRSSVHDRPQWIMNLFGYDRTRRTMSHWYITFDDIDHMIEPHPSSGASPFVTHARIMDKNKKGKKPIHHAIEWQLYRDLPDIIIHSIVSI
jgi:hypothetical protein